MVPNITRVIDTRVFCSVAIDHVIPDNSDFHRQIENLEDLLKEKDNQVDMARARLTAMQAHRCSSEGALSSLEEAIGDKEKQMAQLREQRDRAEQEKQEERELHEREIAEYKMKIHALESEVTTGCPLFKFLYIRIPNTVQHLLI